MDVAAAAGKPLTADEEALRRSTDCVYFLASPLTCKKGVECEFRHSDGARLNPRDCWYWLNGSCLNPKCSFRHPPLDGLYGNPGTSGPAAPASQSAAASTQGPTPTTPAKQNAPCYYFQKGLCLKGDWCPFTHGSQPFAISAMQQDAKASTSTVDPSQRLQALKGCSLKERTDQRNASKINVDRPAEGLRLSTKPVARAETAVNNGQAGMKNLPYQPTNGAHPRPQQTKVHLSGGVDLQGPPNHQPQPGPEQLQNGRKADTLLLGVPSRSDALVDEDNHGRSLLQSRRNMVRADDLDYQHRDCERDQSHRMSECDRHEQVPNQRGRSKRSSTEMFVRQSYVPEEKLLLGSGSSDEVDGSDLRLRLMKQRRLSGSSSALKPDRRGEISRRNDCNAEERNQRRDSERDRQDNHRESSTRNRLQGRISVPRRSSPDRPADIQSERERRSHGRLSPGRPMSHLGRLSERIKWKPDEVRSADIRSSGGKPIERDDADQLNFAAPKSLAELKGLKGSESSLHSAEPKATLLKSQVGLQEPEASLSFEGPKPLSAILKRKRGVASTISRDEEGANNVNPASSLSVLCNMQPIPLDLDDEEEEGQIRAEDEDQLPDDRDSCKGEEQEEDDIPDMADSVVVEEEEDDIPDMADSVVVEEEEDDITDMADSVVVEEEEEDDIPDMADSVVVEEDDIPDMADSVVVEEEEDIPDMADSVVVEEEADIPDMADSVVVNNMENQVQRKSEHGDGEEFESEPVGDSKTEEDDENTTYQDDDEEENDEDDEDDFARKVGLMFS